MREKCKECEGFEDFFAKKIGSKQQCMKTSKDFEGAKVFCLIEMVFCYFCYGEGYLWISGSWKAWKVLEFYSGIFQDWKVLEKGHWSWKVLEIC